MSAEILLFLSADCLIVPDPEGMKETVLIIDNTVNCYPLSDFLAPNLARSRR